MQQEILDKVLLGIIVKTFCYYPSIHNCCPYKPKESQLPATTSTLTSSCQSTINNLVGPVLGMVDCCNEVPATSLLYPFLPKYYNKLPPLQSSRCASPFSQLVTHITGISWYCPAASNYQHLDSFLPTHHQYFWSVHCLQVWDLPLNQKTPPDCSFINVSEIDSPFLLRLPPF